MKGLRASDSCALPSPTLASALAQLVTEAACNPAFAQWLFASPSCALEAVRQDASRALGPGLAGPEFFVPPIPLSDADCRAVISFEARTLAELARAVCEWEHERVHGGSRPAPDLVAVG